MISECAAVTDDLIESIGQCKNLRLLGLQYEDTPQIDVNLDPLFGLANIEKLFIQLNLEGLEVNLNNLSIQCKNLGCLDFSGKSSCRAN